jgi:uncharacterized metal-binding protein
MGNAYRGEVLPGCLNRCSTKFLAESSEKIMLSYPLTEPKKQYGNYIDARSVIKLIL